MTVTQNATAPLVVVVGATGQQGNAVVQAFIDAPKAYRIRGFTRDPTKAAAIALAAQGVEVVAVDVKAENRDAVFKAFEGANIAFLLTTFFEHFSKDTEIADGKLLVDAAAAGGAKKIFWSDLASVEKQTGGKFKNVHHFEAKAIVSEYGTNKFAGSGVSFVSVIVGAYYQLFIAVNPLMVNLQNDKLVISFNLPSDTKFNALDVRELGKWVLEALDNPDFEAGGQISAATEAYTLEEIVKTLAEASGKNFVYIEATDDEFKQRLSKGGFPPPVVEQFYETFAASKYASTPRTKISAPLRSFKEWAVTHDFSALSSPSFLPAAA